MITKENIDRLVKSLINAEKAVRAEYKGRIIPDHINDYMDKTNNLINYLMENSMGDSNVKNLGIFKVGSEVILHDDLYDSDAFEFVGGEVMTIVDIVGGMAICTVNNGNDIEYPFLPTEIQLAEGKYLYM